MSENSYDFHNEFKVLISEFFNKSLNRVYYIPKKRSISHKLSRGSFHKLTVAIKSPNPIGGYEWGDYYFAIALKKALEKKGFNVVVHEFEKWYNDEGEDIVIVLRGKKEYSPKKEHINVMWNISHPELVSLEEYALYDAVFVASVNYAEILHKKLDMLIKPLLQCTDPEVFYPKFNKDCVEDILFVGSTRNLFREIIKDILNTHHDFTVYGEGWNEFIDKKYIKGSFIPNDVLNQYYSSCKILLNDHWQEMKELDFPSNRLFDALACGTFVISDNIGSASTLFEDSIVTYDNEKDLSEKIDYYLNNEYERNKKSELGKKIVLSKHTFDHRVEEIIETLMNLTFK